jgi:glycosyltransferase involved in cell wall biosynthesis
MTPRWTILIATLAQRRARLERLLTCLMPQVDAVHGQVTVKALWNNGEQPIGWFRQQLLESATAEYVSFVDDDDEVPPYFVEKVLPLLDGVDYVGWRMQTYLNGTAMAPTFHSLRYKSWYSDDRGHYRDISHLNPVRRELTKGTSFCTDLERVASHEDMAWTEQMRGRLLTEHYIEDVMYLYWYEHNGDSIQHRLPEHSRLERLHVNSPHFSWLARPGERVLR